MKTKIVVNDLVRVISGNDKGKIGRVLSIIHKPRNKARALVSGVNLVTKHKKGGRVVEENYIYVDKLVRHSIWLVSIVDLDQTAYRVSQIEGTSVEAAKKKITGAILPLEIIGGKKLTGVFTLKNIVQDKNPYYRFAFLKDLENPAQ